VTDRPPGIGLGPSPDGRAIHVEPRSAISSSRSLTLRESRMARNPTAAATSSGFPYRSRAVVAFRVAEKAPASSGFISVLIGPRCTTLTVIPCEPRSRASNARKARRRLCSRHSRRCQATALVPAPDPREPRVTSHFACKFLSDVCAHSSAASLPRSLRPRATAHGARRHFARANVGPRDWVLKINLEYTSPAACLW
jgi:hypothetical protein